MIAALAGLALQVGAGAAATGHASVDAPVTVHAQVRPSRVVVGEVATYELAVFIADEVRQRLRRNPEYVPPDLRGVLAYDLATGGPRMALRDGRRYEVHLFRRALVPVTTGTLEIPPATLTYYLPRSASFFSREETRTVYAEAVRLDVTPVPAAGRPPGWAGAVGTFAASWRGLPATARVGEAFVVSLRIAGRGSVALLDRPPLAVPGASVVVGPERVVLDSGAPDLRGAKEFDWLVTPAREGPAALPDVRYPFFDPRSGRYGVATAAGVRFTVAPGDRVAAVPPPSPPARGPDLPLPLAWRPARSPPLEHRWWVWVVFALAPVPAAVVGWRRRGPARSLGRRPPAWRSLPPDDPRAAIAAVRAAVESRLAPAAPLPWADADALRTALRGHGVTATTADALVAAHQAWDRAAFGDGVAAPGAVAQARSLVAAVDREAVRRAVRRARWGRRAGARAGAVALVGVAVAAAQGGDGAGAFAAGRAAYAAGDLTEARRLFTRATAQVPAGVEGWHALGVVAWAAGDTAFAVRAWLRAVRLDPMARGPREALAAVGASVDGGLGTVPRVPRDLPAAIALAAWVAGWLALARASARGRGRRWAAALVGGAVVAGAAAGVLRWTLTRRDVVVVAAATPLRALPSLAADAGATPRTGEVARVERRQGAWAHLRLADGRRGWVPADRLLVLGPR